MIGTFWKVARSLVQRFLLGIGIDLLPRFVELHDRCRVHVTRGGDAAGAAAAHVFEQHGLGAGKNVKAVRLEIFEHRGRVVPIAR